MQIWLYCTLPYTTKNFPTYNKSVFRLRYVYEGMSVPLIGSGQGPFPMQQRIIKKGGWDGNQNLVSCMN